MQADRIAEIPADVIETAHRVWLAGLGALVVAQHEGAKLVDESTQLFTTLVDKGREVNGAGLASLDSVKNARRKAEDTFAHLQKLVDARVAAALQRLGVPTKAEIADLSRRIEQLTKAIDDLRATKVA
jgi:poly(hydroxyalkanoate) granule-associated protein